MPTHNQVNDISGGTTTVESTDGKVSIVDSCVDESARGQFVEVRTQGLQLAPALPFPSF